MSDRFIGTNLQNLRKRKEPLRELDSPKKIRTEAANKSNRMTMCELKDLTTAVNKMENALILKPATTKRTSLKISAASIVQKLIHVAGMETIFVDPINMSMNLAPCELRETEQGYYLPLKYSQLVSRGAAKLGVDRLKTVILVPKKLFGNGNRGNFFDTVVLFRNKIAYVIAILPWQKSSTDPQETSFPPYIFNILLKEKIWSILDENREPILCREDLSKAVKIQLVEPGIRVYKIANRLRCVKNELLLNGMEMPREYSVEDLKQDTMFNLLDTIRLRRYFEMAMKEYAMSTTNFFIPKFSNFKLKPSDRIVQIV